MLGISSTHFITILHKTGYYMLYLPTLRNTQLSKMIVNYGSDSFRNIIKYLNYNLTRYIVSIPPIYDVFLTN